MKYFKYIITNKFNNMSILNFFKYHYVSAKNLSEYRNYGMLYVNDNIVDFNYLLKTNDILKIINNEEIDFLPDDKQLDILYEDDYLLIINKPAKILVHPDTKEKRGTLVNMVANHYLKTNVSCNVKYIHRLDYETSGIIIFTKSFLMTSYYDKLLYNNQIKRFYHAIVCGKLIKNVGTINLNIGKDRHNSKRRRVSKTGEVAITKYKLVKSFKDYTLVSLELKTGRTHQIRVHMSHIGNVIVGDILYDTKIINNSNMCLLSKQLVILKPLSDELLTIKADYPNFMSNLL